MADNPKVKGIKYGLMQNYLRQEKDRDTLYFITDKGLLYRGDQIVVPTKVIDVVPDDVSRPTYYTFTIEAYADDPANPEVLRFDVWSKAAVTNLINQLSLTISNHTGATASDTVKGHTYLSDATDSDLNAASGGTAATPLAVKNALAAANQYTDEQIANISSGMTIIGTYGLQADNPDEYRGLNDIPAAKGDTYICISTMTGVAYTTAAGIAVSNASLAPGDYIICVQAAVESGGTVTTPARWSIVPNTASNAVTTNETLNEGAVIIGNGHKTVKKLTGGSTGYFLRRTANGGGRWMDHTNLDHGIAYAECTTSESDSHKTIDISGYVLKKYAIVAVRFSNDLLGRPDLSITDGETVVVNRAPIIYHGAIIPQGVVGAGDTATLMYVTNYNITDTEVEVNAWVLISVDRAPDNTPSSLSSFTNDIQALLVCSTAAGNNSKTITNSNITIKAGSVFAVRFSNAVAAGSTLNINNTGAKAIKHRNAAIGNYQIRATDTATFIYDGTAYHVLAIDRAIDTAPTSGSHALVDSDAIYNAIQSAITESALYWEEMQ